MSLTPQQEKFAQCVASGMSQAEAYREAYPKSRQWKPEAVYSNSSTLMADAKVSQRVAELRNELSAKALWTREDSVKALMEVLSQPDRKSDVVAAVKELNSMHGFNAPKKHSINADVNITTIDPAKLSTQAMAEILAARDAADRS